MAFRYTEGDDDLDLSMLVPVPQGGGSDDDDDDDDDGEEEGAEQAARRRKRRGDAGGRMTATAMPVRLGDGLKSRVSQCVF